MSFNKKKTTNFTKKKRQKPKIKKEDKENEFDKKTQYNTGPWTKDEDDLLKEWIEENGERNWNKCGKFIKTRTGKQCREHWNNKLNDKIKKGEWTSEEDLLILKFYKEYRSWKAIIPIFEKRPENSIKNRYFSQLRKIAIKKKTFGKTVDVAKMGLEQLKELEDDAIKAAENVYYYENKDITKEMFDNYKREISNNFKFMGKGKYLDLNAIREKVFNRINDNLIDNQQYDNDSMSCNELEEEKDIKGNKKIGNKNLINNNKRNISKEKKISSVSNISTFPKLDKNSNIIKAISKSDSLIYNVFDNKTRLFGFPLKDQESKVKNKIPLENKDNISNQNINNNRFEVSEIPHKKTSNFLTNKSNKSVVTKGRDSANFPYFGSKNYLKSNEFCDKTSFQIESVKTGKIINPCTSFNSDSKLG